MEGSFKIRNSTIHLQVQRAAEGEPPSCLVDDHPFDYSVEKGLRLTLKDLQAYHIVINQ
jgi:hypothetical protein